MRTASLNPGRFLPLSPQVFQILLSVADDARHGYAIIADIEARTGGEVRLTASTLYDALARLVDHGLIAELSSPPPGTIDHDSRRRYYALSELGRETVRLEAARLQKLVEMARQKNLAHAAPVAKARSRR